MKLVDMTCTGCGANVQVDAAVKVATCTVCGKQMLISHSGEYGAGYEAEMGRIQAQRDAEESWKREREERIRKEQEEKKRAAEAAESEENETGETVEFDASTNNSEDDEYDDYGDYEEN